LFKLITGIYPLDSGKAVVETTDGEMDCKYTKRLFSFVPQDNMLFSGSVRENITILNPQATDEEIRNALENSAAEFAYDLDGGLDFVLGELGAGVSQGQAQRLAIARALLGKGKVLLMDEATSALDSETEKTVMKKLKENDDITVVFITHREMVLEDCDRTITVANGTVTED
jgi:ATP-binding cassette subfamily B protein